MRRIAAEYAAVFATVIGLIGLIWSFDLLGTSRLAASLLVLTAGLTLIVVRYLQARAIQYTILNIEKTLVLHDAEGRRATLTRSSTEMAGSEGLAEIWVRNIAADGQLENVRIDGETAQEGINIVRQLGLMHIRKPLQRSLKKGEKISTVITYDILDSFVKPTEAFIHVVNYRTKKLTIRVQFPEQRPFKSAAFVEVFGGTKPVRLRTLEAGGDTLEVDAQNLHTGANYELRWNW